MHAACGQDVDDGRRQQGVGLIAFFIQAAPQGWVLAGARLVSGGKGPEIHPTCVPPAPLDDTHVARQVNTANGD